MAKKFIESDTLLELANRVIAENKMDWLNDVKIKFLLVDKNISKFCPAKCVKAIPELKYFAEFDYLIQFSNDIWEKVDEKSQEAMMLHCLCHILVSTNEEDDERQLSIADHDLREFALVIRKYTSSYWNELKIAISSIYDLSPAETDKIKI